jgi:hypothetical protein
MDACWQWGYVYMMLKQLRRGYRCLRAAKQCWVKRYVEYTYTNICLQVKALWLNLQLV